MTAARVLVVDDEAPIIELIRGYLERDGMEVIAATDGQVGLDLIRERSPDVVVLDVNLLVARIRALLQGSGVSLSAGFHVALRFDSAGSRKVLP